ncbi:hydrolase HAD superfamily [Butyrivibrio proteoclasticus B316]|uniref:Hydrolase HAD superfamily n=1 Tax=Butyrivibrio proteoclasticus (strain ATCC 51982 / DSM 14932 / B316) TaxID=515622 RepID=E0RY07_BUTPB|nr:HAD family hydrolase [Butyrivibrio proteoclasticus]ADL34962.1 hydrolase HAD superfamily [Butyrivibrio proteoclasticus B316]
MILIFDLFETLVEDLSLDFNRGLKPLWEEHYKDKCSFDEIKAYGEELFAHMQALHKQGFEFPFVKDELPMYAKKYGGDVVSMSIEDEALFLSRCNTVRVYDGLADMLDDFSNKQIPMYVLSNSGFRAGALQIMLNCHGIGKYFDKVWSSADFGRVKPCTDYFESAVGEILNKYPESTRDEILFVGDTYETDITGAHNAGLKAAWINRQNASDIYGFATYQVRDVTGIVNICFAT